MDFIVGDKVSFLNEKLDGVVTKIFNDNRVEVTTEDGFGFPVLAKEILLVSREDKLEKEKNKIIQRQNRKKDVQEVKSEEEIIFAPEKKIKKEIDVVDREVIRKALQEKMQTKVIGKISLQHSHRRKEVEGEIDLHIENLLDKWKGMSNGEIVLHQLSTAREAIDDAILAKKHRLVIIHGVGNGTLKKEVRKLIESYPGIRCEDGHFSVYGAGATLVHL